MTSHPQETWALASVHLDAQRLLLNWRVCAGAFLGSQPGAATGEACPHPCLNPASLKPGSHSVWGKSGDLRRSKVRRRRRVGLKLGSPEKLPGEAGDGPPPGGAPFAWIWGCRKEGHRPPGVSWDWAAGGMERPAPPGGGRARPGERRPGLPRCRVQGPGGRLQLRAARRSCPAGAAFSESPPEAAGGRKGSVPCTLPP